MFCVDVYSKLKQKDDELFFFDLILDLSDKKYLDFAKQWFYILSKQDELNLYVRIDGISRRHPVLQYFHIREWHNLMKEWIMYLANHSIDYIKATKYIQYFKLNKLKRSVVNELIQEANAPKNRYDELMILINHYIGSHGSSNKQSTEVFSLIANHFKKTKKLELPVALIDDKIIWRKLKINSPEPELTELNVVVQTASTYGYLLDGNRWDKILDPTDILVPRIYELTISSLCDIPSEETFNKCDCILSEAVSNREFTINEPTSIFIDKDGI